MLKQCLSLNLIRALVSQSHETQALACGGGGDGVRTKTIISPKFQISGYNYICKPLSIRIGYKPRRS